MTDDPTIKDLFLAINAVRGDVKAVDKKVDDLRSEMNARFDDQDGQLEAIRNVVDNELASQSQLDAVEAHVKDVQRTLRQHGKRLDAIERGQKHPA